MGCAISGLAAKSEFAERSRDEAAAAHPSEEQIQMIKDSWKVIRDDIAKVGIIMFVRVMSFIEKSVARLDQLEILETLAVELGKSHYHYNAPPKYYSYVGSEFICAVQPILKEKWTTELEEAWKTMFQYVTSLMKQGYQEESIRQRHLASSPKDRLDKRNTAL
ncbi:x globin isoform X2 [Melanotaenia boesemani]|uniref:x globin isoform X2 n=1 Tax=Melanotaenia boesemani TaxID=1250792 RepID=UPI001C05DD6D|nr:x globin isoform X2 [Melanotaenia boesemani]